jgi:hypothetical protein
MEFGAEGGLEKSVDDFGVGEGLLLGVLPRGDGGILGAVRRRDSVAEGDRSEGEHEYP